jgi:hypothetical protein
MSTHEIKCNICQSSGKYTESVCVACGNTVDHCNASTMDCVGAGNHASLEFEERPCWLCEQAK